MGKPVEARDGSERLVEIEVRGRPSDECIQILKDELGYGVKLIGIDYTIEDLHNGTSEIVRTRLTFSRDGRQGDNPKLPRAA